MVKLRNTIWLVMACLAVVTPVVPQAWGEDCDRGCCVAESGGCCSACPAESPEPPCHCQLEARQDQPLSGSKDRSPQSDLLTGVAMADSVALKAPRELGVSRDYLAASLSVPIRPIRILCGVWRN